MEESTDKTKVENLQGRDAGIADAVLKYLAESHPEDEDALEVMTDLLGGGHECRKLLDAVYDGLRLERAVDEADKAGYLRGRNEAVEMKRRELYAFEAADDGGVPEDDDVPLLRNIRRSVWD